MIIKHLISRWLKSVILNGGQCILCGLQVGVSKRRSKKLNLIYTSRHDSMARESIVRESVSGVPTVSLVPWMS